MKMRKVTLFLFASFFIFSTNTFAWGRMGHDAIAYIAECNLTKNAKKNIEKYLDRSIVYYASWMDEYRETPEYKHTTVWHGAPVDKDYYYTDELKKPTGDAIQGLEGAIEILKNYKSQDDSTVVANLKYIIHLVGDMHCPVHIKYPDVKMNFNITLNGKEYSYHAVWDSQIIEMKHRWGYMEWQHQLDRCTKEEKAEIMKGTPREWFHESAVNCRKIYDLATPGSAQGKDFLNATQPLAESQILKAGYRLAAVLNQLFDK